ncbi:MAG: hypothetical protein QOI34_501, partial [Verrucomicrobiota bacterium]
MNEPVVTEQNMDAAEIPLKAPELAT